MSWCLAITDRNLGPLDKVLSVGFLHRKVMVFVFLTDKCLGGIL